MTSNNFPSIIPVPKRLQMKPGYLPLNDIVVTLGNCNPQEVNSWLAYLRKQFTRLGIGLRADLLSARTEPVFTLRQNGCIFLKLAITDSGNTEEEQYRLEVTQQGISLESSSAAGIVHGLQTLLQLVWQAYQQESKALPCLDITDTPQYEWRGLHLDVSRHFFSVEEVKTCLDWMALLKLNRFHWHLTDDQGFRIESKKFPLLTDVGAWRKESDGSVYGGFYTRDEIKDVVSYASDLAIEVIPEIDIPGHSQAILSAYPEFACFPQKFEPLTCWGISENILCAGKPEVTAFLKELFTETAELFPGRWFHLGGDEAPKENWKKCPHCQSRIRAENLANEEELQSRLVLELVEHLKKSGKTVVGWDEILDGNIDQEPIVMVWRGDGKDAARKASRQGNRYILSPNSITYFDWRQSDKQGEPGAFGVTTLEKVYSFNPSEYAFGHPELLLGAQANVWTEQMPDFTRVKYMVLPRAWALSETLWCSTEQKDWSSFQTRLNTLGEML
jgi:hexosaminidase